MVDLKICIEIGTFARKAKCIRRNLKEIKDQKTAVRPKGAAEGKIWFNLIQTILH
jgi:hypothetical protein